ncbi:site-specific DNA-methyltransferase [Candidatus Micrarchaeota archaeon CG10_big_fil_rev_8_21_14_0_10_45_29]|nr:MAG: site-specific DNA-methyltransferase [Candidatus Micrarchaeota archaeon CG10_big_fil_rev_8_21_14_0_10_45_29]
MDFNKVYEIDCINGMNEVLEENSIDIIVTSPPYNIGVKYNSHNDNMEFKDYLEWMNQFGKACKRVLKDNGSLFFNIGDKASDEFKAFDVAKQVNNNNLILQNTIHWIKSIAVPEEDINIGHYKPINSRRYLNNLHEYVFHFTKSGSVTLDRLAIGVPYADKSNIGRWKSVKNDLRDRGNIWYIPYETVKSEKEHPAAFPKRLPEMCIKLHGFNENTIVLDPFMGSGTTCVVAKELGCKYLGFEIDKEYANLSRSKLSQKEISNYISAQE